MIHPQYWSLASIYASIYTKLKYGIMSNAIHKKDIEAYLQLPIKGNVVLDVGAYNGDSAMLFLKHGAKKSYALRKIQL